MPKIRSVAGFHPDTLVELMHSARSSSRRKGREGRQERKGGLLLRGTDIGYRKKTVRKEVAER